MVVDFYCEIQQIKIKREKIISNNNWKFVGQINKYSYKTKATRIFS